MSGAAGRFRPLISIGVVLAAVVGIYFAAKALPLAALGEIRSRAIPWAVLPPMIVVQILFMLAGAELWRRLVRRHTGQQQGFAAAYMQMAVVTVGKYVPGKVWGFVARTGDMRRQNIPMSAAITSSLVEQLMLLFGALMVIVGSALIVFVEDRVLVVAAGALSFGAIGFACLRLPELSAWLIRRREGVVGSADAKTPVLTVRILLRFGLGYAALWLASGAIFAAIYFSLFDAVLTTERIAALLLANTAGIVIGFFAFFLPAGIGVREAAAAIILGAFVPVKEALLAAIAYRAWLVLFDGVNGVVIVLREARGAAIAPVNGESVQD